VTSKKRVDAAIMRQTILALCAEQALTLESLEILLKRNGEFLRKKHLQYRIKTKQLRHMYPTQPNHPQQAYITAGPHAD
jgi:hypothetical protein